MDAKTPNEDDSKKIMPPKKPPRRSSTANEDMDLISEDEDITINGHNDEEISEELVNSNIDEGSHSQSSDKINSSSPENVFPSGRIPPRRSLRKSRSSEPPSEKVPSPPSRGAKEKRKSGPQGPARMDCNTTEQPENEHTPSGPTPPTSPGIKWNYSFANLFHNFLIKKVIETRYLVIFLSITCACGGYVVLSQGQPSMPYSPKTPKEFLNVMQLNYRNQLHEELRHFVRQVEYARQSTALNAQSTIFTLIHNDIPDTADKIGRELVLFAADRFHQGSDIFTLDASVLPFDYFPQEMYHVRNKVNETGTLLVTNFEKIPLQVAGFFHAICDKYTPFVNNKAVYVLVLNTDKSLNEINDHKGWRDKTIQTMTSLWASLDDSILSPLITRLTENVMKVYPEYNKNV